MITLTVHFASKKTISFDWKEPAPQTLLYPVRVKKFLDQDGPAWKSVLFMRRGDTLHYDEVEQ